jgi:hypothetical protein
MGTIVSETCWAVSTLQSNKYRIGLHQVGCFIEYLKMHGTTNLKKVKLPHNIAAGPEAPSVNTAGLLQRHISAINNRVDSYSRPGVPFQLAFLNDVYLYRFVEQAWVPCKLVWWHSYYTCWCQCMSPRIFQYLLIDLDQIRCKSLYVIRFSSWN